jgi:histidinol-phosphate aminotransferase
MRTLMIQPRSALSNLKSYTPGKPIWEVQQELRIERVIKLASNENPLGPSPKALEAMQTMMTDIHRYPDASAIILRQSIAAVYDVPVECVVMSNGADEMIKLISEAYLDVGDEIVTPTPTFTEYEFAAKLMGADVIQVPLGPDFEYDIEALLKAVSSKTKIIYLCSPNNPTGTYLRKQQLEKLLTNLPKRILVVLDAAYSHYAEDDDYADGVYYVKKGYPIIVVHTFSKVYGLAGMRVGFGMASKEIMDNIQKVREPFNVNALAQVAATAAIQDTNHLERSKSCVTEGRNQLYHIFDGLGLSYTQSSSNFILVEFGERARTVYTQLLQLGIIVRHGELWGLPDHLRITVGTHEDNELLGQALLQIIGTNKLF